MPIYVLKISDKTVKKMERLHKYLARAGKASRRHAEEMIKAGRVRVNGRIVTEMGCQIDPESDVVLLDGQKVLLTEKAVYILLNKPAQVVTTLDDPQGRRKVSDLLQGINERVYPVGRLDYDTEGLLVLTNDGDLAYRLTHPKHKVDKVYIAVVKGEVTDKVIDTLRSGVMLEDGRTMPAKVRRLAGGSQTTLEITIHEGKNRQVRRMCEAVGHPVIALKRVGFGPLALGGIEPGSYRHLNKQELRSLQQACGYRSPLS